MHFVRSAAPGEETIGEESKNTVGLAMTLEQPSLQVWQCPGLGNDLTQDAVALGLSQRPYCKIRNGETEPR